MGDEYGLEYDLAEALYDWAIGLVMDAWGESRPKDIEANYSLLTEEQQTPYHDMANVIMDMLEDNPEELRAILDA